MRAPHHPTVESLDGCWLVDCPECRQAQLSTPNGDVRLPIGIGMPLESRLTAERLRDNHAGRLATTG